MFKDKDRAQKLIDLIAQERRELATREKKLEGLKPEWQKAHAAVTEIAVRLRAQADTYTRDISEALFREAEEKLRADFTEALARRDNLIGDLLRQISSLRGRISRRLACVTGPFSSSMSMILTHTKNGSITPQCDSALQEELSRARKQAEGISDPEALFSLIQDVTEKVESADGLQLIPLLRLDSAIVKALEVE